MPSPRVQRVESIYNTKVKLSTRRAIQASILTGIVVGIAGDYLVRPRIEKFIYRHGVNVR